MVALHKIMVDLFDFNFILTIGRDILLTLSVLSNYLHQSKHCCDTCISQLTELQSDEAMERRAWEIAIQCSATTDYREEKNVKKEVSLMKKLWEIH